MATGTLIGGVGIDTSGVATVAIDGRMSSGQGIIITMNGEGCRLPTWVSSMTSFTGCGYLDGCVIGIISLVVIILMTTDTIFGCIVIVTTRVAIAAIRSCMGSGQWIIVIMNSESCRLPPRVCRMTANTGRRDSQGNMVWIVGLVINSQMTGRTFCWGSTETADMAVGAWCCDVCSGQWENRCVMIKTAVFTSCWMALITSNTGISISSNAFVPVVHIGLIMGMAIDTSERFIACGVSMTIGTAIPGTNMFPGINREELGIMNPEFGRFPAGSQSVAIVAGSGDIGSKMVRICGGIVILQVAGNTLFGKVCIVSVDVTLAATDLSMTFGKWEEGMVKTGSRPGKTG